MVPGNPPDDSEVVVKLPDKHSRNLAVVIVKVSSSCSSSSSSSSIGE